MARFFFDFCQGEELAQDTMGAEFATTEEAYLEVSTAAQDMWGELLKKRCDPLRCQFEVRDADRNLLFVFPFQEAMDNCRDRKRPVPTPNLDRAAATATATAGRVKTANDAFQRTLFDIRATLAESRALLATKADQA